MMSLLNSNPTDQHQLDIDMVSFLGGTNIIVDRPNISDVQGCIDIERSCSFHEKF